MFYKVNKPEVLLANRASAIRVESLCYYIPSHAQYRTRVQAWNIVHNKRSKLLARCFFKHRRLYRTSGGNPLHRQTNSTLLTGVSKVSLNQNEQTSRGNQRNMKSLVSYTQILVLPLNPNKRTTLWSTHQEVTDL